MKLDYVVLTSVDRDDLDDGGASHYAKVVKQIKIENHKVKIEVLTPDFSGNTKSLELLINSEIDVFAQNIETVRRLTPIVRDNRSGYDQTIKVLEYVKKRSSVFTKSSVMLGLGEEKKEVLRLMDDLRNVGVDVFTLGQYMQPTENHFPISRFVSPEEFSYYRKVALSKGFKEVFSGPMVRSSYRADSIFNKLQS